MFEGAARQDLMQEVAENGRGKAGSMAGEVDKGGFFAENVFDELQGFEEGLFNFIEFAAFTAPEGGRVEEDGIVTSTASLFALRNLLTSSTIHRMG